MCPSLREINSQKCLENEKAELAYGDIDEMISLGLDKGFIVIFRGKFRCFTRIAFPSLFLEDVTDNKFCYDLSQQLMQEISIPNDERIRFLNIINTTVYWTYHNQGLYRLSFS